MTIIDYSTNGATPFQRLLGHQQELMMSWTRLSDLLENGGALSKELKEEIRRMLAQKNGCIVKQKVNLPAVLKMKNQ
ncbi:Uncharacterised protein [Staphylococcus devriesei]|nr:Uncharacterised protein [Staphylococcus devriesei]